MYNQQVRLLRRLPVNLDPTEYLDEGTLLTFNPENDRYIKCIDTISILVNPPLVREPTLLKLKLNVDAEIAPPKFGELGKEDMLKILDFKDSISLKAKIEVDYLVGKFFAVSQEYYENGNPKVTQEDQFDLNTRLLILSRAYNSLINQHMNAVSEVYSRSGLRKVAQVQAATDIWIDQAYNKIKASGAPDMEVILEALSGLKYDKLTAGFTHG